MIDLPFYSGSRGLTTLSSVHTMNPLYGSYARLPSGTLYVEKDGRLYGASKVAGTVAFNGGLND